MSAPGSPDQTYDFLLKFLLVGDSDVGKGEILESLQDGAAESPYSYLGGIDYKTTTILLDGQRVKLKLWDTSGQGRFCTIFRSYSRGAQGVILVYDIAKPLVFRGMDRWIKKIDEHALVSLKSWWGIATSGIQEAGAQEQAQAYAERLGVTFFEVELAREAEQGTELARPLLPRHRVLHARAPGGQAPAPVALRSHLKSFSMAKGLNARMMRGLSYSLTASSTHNRSGLCKMESVCPPQSPPKTCTRNSCKIS
ncbi:Ras-related protein Rab-40A-like [Plecturocebus cupreus]